MDERPVGSTVDSVYVVKDTLGLDVFVLACFERLHLDVLTNGIVNSQSWISSNSLR